MNEINNENQEFEILGFKVRFKSQVGESVDASKVVELINREAINIKKQHPSLDNGQVAILVSLKVAAEKIAIENDYKENVERLRSTALDALHLIEEVSPTTV